MAGLILPLVSGQGRRRLAATLYRLGMTIEELAATEQRLMERVAATEGEMEERHRLLQAAGIFNAYRDVHRAYVRIAESTGDLEALKRAAFLQWYAVVEPGCFTGLWDLDRSAQRSVFAMLENLIASESLDGELDWMLPYYYELSDFYLDAFDGYSRLKSFSASRQGHVAAPVAITPEAFRRRGQMGTYWLSIDQTAV